MIYNEGALDFTHDIYIKPMNQGVLLVERLAIITIEAPVRIPHLNSNVRSLARRMGFLVLEFLSTSAATGTGIRLRNIKYQATFGTHTAQHHGALRRRC